MPAITFDDKPDGPDSTKKFWVLALVILGFTLKGLLWLGLGGAIVAGYRRLRRRPVALEEGEEAPVSERAPLLEDRSAAAAAASTATTTTTATATDTAV